jgi:hypothetical protein
MTEAQMAKAVAGCSYCTDVVNAPRRGDISETSSVQGFSSSDGSMSSGLLKGRGATNGNPCVGG